MNSENKKDNLSALTRCPVPPHLKRVVLLTPGPWLLAEEEQV